MNTIQNKITELLFLLNQSQINSDIPNIKLEADPEIKQRIADAKTQGITLTGEDFIEKISDNDFMMRLQDNVNRWKQDIHNVIKLDRQVSQGNVLQEINFWKDYETTLLNSNFFLNFFSSEANGIIWGSTHHQHPQAST